MTFLNELSTIHCVDLIYLKQKLEFHFSKNHKACYLSISFITDGLHTLHNVQSSDYSEFTASLNGILKAALSLDTVLTALMGKATVFFP